MEASMNKEGRIRGVDESILVEMMRMLIEENNNQIEIIGKSMEPTYVKGQVLTIIMEDYVLEIGDVITFLNKDHLTTHRIIDILFMDNEIYYITKGDGNLDSREKVSGKLVLGKINK